MTRTKDDPLDEIEAIRLSIERYNAQRDVLEMGIAV